MRYLIATAPNFTDTHMIGPVVEQLILDSAGEMVTLLIDRRSVGLRLFLKAEFGRHPNFEVETWQEFTPSGWRTDGVLAFGETPAAEAARRLGLSVTEFVSSISD